jgi:hypothetical protein
MAQQEGWRGRQEGKVNPLCVCEQGGRAGELEHALRDSTCITNNCSLQATKQLPNHSFRHTG